MDWRGWHDDYADPASALSRRLAVVQARIRAWADVAPRGPLRVLSMCAGQGHDLVGALGGHARRDDVTGVLVELDPDNVRAASAAIDDAGLGGLRAVTGDAGTTTAYEADIPADLLVVCGVFGNVSDDDIERTVGLLATLSAPGAHVVWTRHRLPPDRTPAIRRWFAESGFAEVDFTSPAPAPGSRAEDGRSGARFAVGTHRLVAEPRPYRAGVRLFRFLDRPSGAGQPGR